MKLEEKLRNEHPELADYNYDELIASTARVNGEFKECQKTNCNECDFDFTNGFHNCYAEAEEWLNSEV